MQAAVLRFQNTDTEIPCLPHRPRAPQSLPPPAGDGKGRIQCLRGDGQFPHRLLLPKNRILVHEPPPPGKKIACASVYAQVIFQWCRETGEAPPVADQASLFRGRLPTSGYAGSAGWLGPTVYPLLGYLRAKSRLTAVALRNTPAGVVPHTPFLTAAGSPLSYQ